MKIFRPESHTLKALLPYMYIIIMQQSQHSVMHTQVDIVKTSGLGRLVHYLSLA